MSKAAVALNISPQGISIAIRRLEKELGAQLFYRDTSGLVITSTGEAVRQEAEKIINHIDKIHNICTVTASGKAEISVVITTGRFIRLPVSLQNLLITPPEEFSVTLEHLYSTACMDRVYNGDALFGLTYGYCDPEKFYVRQIEDVEQVFFVNNKHPLANRGEISISELDGLPIVMPGTKTQPGMALSKIFSDNKLKLKIAYETLIPHQAIELVTTNPELVAFSPISYFENSDEDAVSMLRLKEHNFVIPFSLIYKKGRKLDVHEQLFMHMILDCYNS
jgi:DNA-binding transcriptional LysR family regulator